MFLLKLINKGYQAESCDICHISFSEGLLSERVHKCKRCNKFICAKCGNQKEKVIEEDGTLSTEKHRICLRCKRDYDQIRQSVKEGDMKWCQDGKLAINWLAASTLRDYEYEHFLKLFYKNQHNFEEEIDLIDKDVLKGRTDFSVFDHSTREFFFTVQETSNAKELVRVNMANLLYAVAARFDRIGYCQGMSALAAFLLCFASQKTAFSIFCVLLEEVYPANFFARSDFGVALFGLLAELHFLKEYYVIFLKKKSPLISHEREPFSNQQIDYTLLAIDLMGTKALLSLFIGLLSFSNLIFVWERLFESRKFEVIEAAFIAMVYLNREKIIAHKSCKIMEQNMNSIDPEQFREIFAQIRIDKSVRSRLLEQYYEQTSKKWSNKANSKNLSKVTNFTPEEIQILQKNFADPLTLHYSLNQCQEKEGEVTRMSEQRSPQSRIVIRREEFQQVIQCYYGILKENAGEAEPILQISSFFVRKIFDSYNSAQKEGLDFRQFVCCLSICTKSRLKDRMCAVVNTFQDKNQQISKANFFKLIENLCSISPRQIERRKTAFLDRMNKHFLGKQELSINHLYILLNDDFINELTLYLRSDCKDIIKLTCERFRMLK